MKKSFIILPLVVLIVLGFWYYQKNKVEAHEFSGRVHKVNAENQSLTVQGVYVVKDRPDLSNPSNAKIVTILINKDTKIVKERLKLPTLEEAEKTGGRYDPSKLRREQTAGSLSDLNAENVSISAKASKNIYGRSSFAASEIIYIEPVFP